MAQARKKENPLDYFHSPAGHIRDRIVIHDNQDIPKGGQFVSLNGYAFLIKPGEEIDLPRPVRLMLDTRIKTDNMQDDTGKMHTRDMPRFTYTLIKEGVNLELPPDSIDPPSTTSTEDAEALL
jgi:hypothetical protein